MLLYFFLFQNCSLNPWWLIDKDVRRKNSSMTYTMRIFSIYLSFYIFHTKAHKQKSQHKDSVNKPDFKLFPFEYYTFLENFKIRKTDKQTKQSILKSKDTIYT